MDVYDVTAKKSVFQKWFTNFLNGHKFGNEDTFKRHSALK